MHLHNVTVSIPPLQHEHGEFAFYLAGYSFILSAVLSMSVHNRLAQVYCIHLHTPVCGCPPVETRLAWRWRYRLPGPLSCTSRAARQGPVRSKQHHISFAPCAPGLHEYTLLARPTDLRHAKSTCTHLHEGFVVCKSLQARHERILALRCLLLPADTQTHTYTYTHNAICALVAGSAHTCRMRRCQMLAALETFCPAHIPLRCAMGRARSVARLTACWPVWADARVLLRPHHGWWHGARLRVRRTLLLRCGCLLRLGCVRHNEVHHSEHLHLKHQNP